MQRTTLKMEERKVFSALNGWRFLFAMMIIWHHFPDSYKNFSINLDFGNTIVTFFFILSGFLLTIGYKDKIKSNEISYKDFIRRRISAIFPLQWIMTILFVIFNINIASYWALPFHLTLTQSLIPYWEINFAINTPSWFLSSIFICYLLTYPILLLFSERKYLFLMSYLIMLMLWNLFLYFLPESIGTRWLCYISPFSRIFDYSIGIVVGLYWSSIVKVSQRFLGNKINATILELSIVVAVSCMFYQPLSVYINNVVIRYIILFIFIIIFSLSEGVFSRILGLNLFQYMGSLSIAIYMCHGFVLHFTNNMDCLSVWNRIIITYILVLIFSYILKQYCCPYIQNLIVKIACVNREK